MLLTLSRYMLAGLCSKDLLRSDISQSKSSGSLQLILGCLWKYSQAVALQQLSPVFTEVDREKQFGLRLY